MRKFWEVLYAAAGFPAACLHGIPCFGFFSSSPATRKNAVCLAGKKGFVKLDHECAKRKGLVNSSRVGRWVLLPKEIHHFSFGVWINILGGVQCLLHVVQPPLRSLMSDGEWAVASNQRRMACWRKGNSSVKTQSSHIICNTTGKKTQKANSLD